MVREESLVDAESREYVADSAEYVYELFEVFSEASCQLGTRLA